MAVLETIRERIDAFYNAVTGLGAVGSKGRASSFVADTAPDPERLDDLFAGDWLSKRIVTGPVDDALAKGFDVAEDDGSVYEQWRAWNHSDKHPGGAFQAAAYEGRLHGGGLLVAGFNSDPQTPLPDAPGELRWLEVYNRHEIKIISRYEDANEYDYGDPEVIRIEKGRRKNQLVHASRILWFEGDPPGTTTKREELDDFWHESVLRAPMRAIERYGYSWEAVSHMLQEADLKVMTLQGLANAIATDNGQAFLQRMRLMNATQGIAGVTLLDADGKESLQRYSANFSGVKEILEAIGAELAGATNMPQTTLFGREPAGLSATGESDLSNYYHMLEVRQETSYKPKLETMLWWITGEEHEIEFPSLWQKSDKEKAEERKLRFEGDLALQKLGADGVDLILARVEDGTLGVDLSDDAIAALEAALEEQDGEQTTQIPGQPGAQGAAAGAAAGAAGAAVPPGGTLGAPGSAAPVGSPL